MGNPSLRLLLSSLSLAVWLACLLLGLLPALVSHVFLLLAIVVWPRQRQSNNTVSKRDGPETRDEDLPL